MSWSAYEKAMDDIGANAMGARGMQPYTLDIDGVRILVTRKRVKNVNFRLGPGGEPRMSVPWHFSKDEAERMAREHIDWFVVHGTRFAEARAGAPVAWETGERLRVWGQELELDVCETDGSFSCACDGDRLVVRVPPGSTAEGRKRFVERWLVGELRTRLVDLLPVCEERVGVYATSVTLRRMKTRWGSCTSSTRRIRINTALAECPPECLEMVLVHELCHILEPNHGARFHALMDLHVPSWRVWQRWLNEHPPRV